MKKYKKIAKEAAKRYLETPNLIGIIWIGSTTYGITDELADIDIFLVVTKKNESFQMEQFKEDGVKIEVSQSEINWLLEEKGPDSERYWIREKAVILFDPSGALKRVFKKANLFKKKKYKKAIWKAYKEIFSSYHASNCVKRGQLITAQMYLLKTFEALSRFIFLYHKKPVPPFKWRWYFIEKEKLFDLELIERAVSATPISKKIAVLKEIEETVKKLMSKRETDRRKIEEPWRF